MNTLKLQQDALKARAKNPTVVCAVDEINNAVWITPAEGAVALYRIPRAEFYLDIEKLKRTDSLLKSLAETPKNWAKPTEHRRGKKGQLIQFNTENGKPAYFDEKLLKPFKDIYKEVYRISDNGVLLHVLDGEGNTKALILTVKVREEA